MSQVLASTHVPVPNVFDGFLGDHGTLMIRTGSTWHVWSGMEWQPSKHGFTARELWAEHKIRPPSNVNDGWAGIVHGGPFPQNWTRRELRAAMEGFMTAHADEYSKPDGRCWDPLKKGRLLKRSEMQKRGDRVMVKAPAPQVEQWAMGH